jgi:hypothetical protein
VRLQLDHCPQTCSSNVNFLFKVQWTICGYSWTTAPKCVLQIPPFNLSVNFLFKVQWTMCGYSWTTAPICECCLKRCHEMIYHLEISMNLNSNFLFKVQLTKVRLQVKMCRPILLHVCKLFLLELRVSKKTFLKKWLGLFQNISNALHFHPKKRYCLKTTCYVCSQTSL